jgi:hypothetical protein
MGSGVSRVSPANSVTGRGPEARTSRSYAVTSMIPMRSARQWKAAAPQRLLTVRESIDAALGKLEAHEVETSWSDAGPLPGDPDWSGGKVFVDRRTIQTMAGAEAVFRAICHIGGGQGYYAADWLWHLRGWMDRLLGGPGLRRGRRDPEKVGYGEALDFWRVTGIEPNRRLELRAEMKLPGEASLEFEVQPHPEDHGGCKVVQTARFKPRGLLGLAYWYAVLPLHSIVFSGMLKGIRRAAEESGRDNSTRGSLAHGQDCKRRG